MSSNYSTNRSTTGRALGWFSIALGVTELCASRQLAEFLGLSPRSRRWIQAFGVRELISGIGILSQNEKPVWLWSRVAGDGIDLAALSLAAATSNRKSGAALAAAAVAGVTVADVWCARRQSAMRARPTDKLGVKPREESSLILNRDLETVRQRWAEFAPDFPFGVRFQAARGGRGTIIRVATRNATAFQDVRRFKQLVETGEVLLIAGQPSGRTKSLSTIYDRDAA